MKQTIFKLDTLFTMAPETETHKIPEFYFERVCAVSFKQHFGNKEKTNKNS